MNKKEFSVFASALKNYYPREKLLPTLEALQLWYTHLQDIPFNTAEKILNEWVSVNKWSPTIADIKEKVKDQKEREKINELEKLLGGV